MKIAIGEWIMWESNLNFSPEPKINIGQIVGYVGAHYVVQTDDYGSRFELNRWFYKPVVIPKEDMIKLSLKGSV